MKKYISTCLLSLTYLILPHSSIGQIARIIPCYIPNTIGTYPLLISQRFTTNLIFPAPIIQVDMGTADILVKKPESVDNVLLLKANIPDFRPTNLSVYARDGRLYSFYLQYADSLETFNYSFKTDSILVKTSLRDMAAVILQSGQARPIGDLDQDAAQLSRLHGRNQACTQVGKIRLRLRSIVLKDNFLWLNFKSNNKSAIPFEPEVLRFYLADAKALKRTAKQEVEIAPVYANCPTILQNGDHTTFSIAFKPFTIESSKRLILEWNERSGGRRLQLIVKGKYILQAKNLTNEK